MNRDDARQVLQAWRPDGPGREDPDVARALRMAADDPELQTWLERHIAFQSGARDLLRSLPVPPDLAERIRAEARIARPQFGLRVLWGAAAAVLLLGGLLASLWLGHSPERADFSTFRGRMVRAALREYRMDVVTNDLASIRRFLASRQAPADFQLTPSLSRLTPVGGGLLSWQGRPVSMVCLDGGQMGMLYLFIVPTVNLENGVPGGLDLQQVNRLGTVSWSSGERTYLLAAAAPPDELRKLL
jgi:hypothetical protein